MKHAEESERRNRDRFFTLAGRHLDGLSRFVRREIAYAEAAGDLAPAELTVEDVVDGVLLRAYDEFAKGPARKVEKSWLLRLAIERLESEVRRSTTERNRTVHIEEDVPETSPAEAVSTLGEEILDFYEPDEDLKLEDIIPEIKIPTPDQVAERRELQQCMNAALATMPKTWRQALLLRYGEDVSGADLANVVLPEKPEEVEHVLGRAREYLRRKLVEAGCVDRS